MAVPCPKLINGSPLVVGSAGSAPALRAASAKELVDFCDLLEVRLDLLEGKQGSLWQHLTSLPLLFTARRSDEGGHGHLNASERMDLLRDAIDDAALIDIEVASIKESALLLHELNERKLPWIASFHDFDKLPEEGVLAEACQQAREAGAAAFKLAAHLKDEADLQRLVDFQAGDHGLPTATMGMGELGAQSRISCAKAGSVLNYGHLGDTPTAPGQVSARELKAALKR